MSPRKKTVAKKSSKHLRFDNKLFRSRDAFEAHANFFSSTMIIVEREVNLDSLSQTFIPEVFRDWTWTKFLDGLTKVWDPIIQEFFSNVIVEGEHLNCWVRGRQFYVTLELIQDLLEVRPVIPKSTLPYDGRRTKITFAIEVLGGKEKKQSMHTVDFSPAMKALAYIMIFNLYPVKNLTTLSQPKTLFLHDLYTGEEIDICAQIYHLFAKCIRKKSTEMTFPFPGVIMSIL